MSRAAELRSYSEGRDGKGIKLMATEGCGEARRWTFSCPTLTRWQEWCGVVLCCERDRERVAARKTHSETPWRTAGGGQCLGQSLIERADCSVMHQRHA